MRLIHNTGIKEFDGIIKHTFQMLHSSRYHNELKTHFKDFKKSTHVNGDFLSRIISGQMSMEHTVEIKLFWHWRKKVVGKFNPKTPNVIYFNKRNLKIKLKNKQFSKIAATIVHELVHYFDFRLEALRFGHEKNKYAKWMEETAPYYADFIAEYLYPHNKYQVEPRDIEETWVIKKPFVIKDFLEGKWF